MGNVLPKAVESIVVKRFSGESFRVGFAEMNGFRQSMEDAHVVYMKATWAFFGVFDGHGGAQCSAFVAKRFTEELASSPDKPPKDDAALKDLSLRLDKEFLDTGQSSGSTGTFAVVTPPAQAGGRYCIRVGNVGDSRILLGRKDGTMVEGSGTDGGITTDHKPDYPSERARIERNGGRVEDTAGGVARVNGELAVSRAFGDAYLKETGGPGPEERPVTADPELVTLDCDATDFLMLVCDGISEGEFPNREVVQLAADKLWPGTGDKVDPGAAATAVCRRALEKGSRDNLSCMIVLLGGGEVPGAESELLPGPVDSFDNQNFRTAYAAMASHCDLTAAEAVEMRYGHLQKLLEQPGSDDDLEALQHEMDKFNGGPPEDIGPVGSAARVAWFGTWITRMQTEGAASDGDSTGGVPQGLLRLLQEHPQLCQQVLSMPDRDSGGNGGES